MNILWAFLVVFAKITLCSGQVILPNIGTFIVNGTRASSGQFPYIVSIRVGGQHNCGGAIINKRWILTAAHCASDDFEVELLSVVAGIDTLDQSGDEYAVEVKIPHAEWSSVTNMNDIALLKVDRDIELNKKLVTEIPLPRNNEVVPNQAEITIAGWGYTQYPSTDASNELNFVKLSAVDKEMCQQLWSTSQKITHQHLCAQNVHHQGTCLGDSGGPYVHNDRVVGVHIFGDWCKLNKPSVATRVSEYLNWIEENMTANQ